MSLIMLVIGNLLALGDGINRKIRDTESRNSAIKDGELWYSDSFGNEYLVSNNHRCDITICDKRKVLIDKKTNKIVHDYTKESEDKKIYSKKIIANEIKEKNIKEREEAKTLSQTHYISEDLDGDFIVKHNRRVSDDMINIIKNGKYNYKENYIGVYNPYSGKVKTRYYFTGFINAGNIPLSESHFMHYIYNERIHKNSHNLWLNPIDEEFIKQNNIETDKILYEDFMKKYGNIFC